MRSRPLATGPAFALLAALAPAQSPPDQRLTVDVAFSATTFDNARSVAADGDTVHVVWFDTRDGNREIYAKRSLDSGLTWGADVRLTSDAAISHFPSVAVAGANVHLAWEECRHGNPEIYYKRSTDGGATWGADVRLTENAASSLSPSVAVSGSEVHVAWQEHRDGNAEIYSKRSDDGGATWGPDVRLTTALGGSLAPNVTAAGSVVNVVWEDGRDTNSEIYAKRSVDGGLTWGPDTRLTVDAAHSFTPSAASTGSDVHVVWFDDRDGNMEVYTKRSTDGGLTWSADTRLTAHAGLSHYACVAASGPDVHVAWIDERDANTEIYAKRSSDGGATFGPDIRMTSDAARSTDPSVAIAGPHVHVVWTDARDAGWPYDGNYEIYYERGPASAAETATVFCIGDGFAPNAACPCGNHSPTADGSGCLNSFGVGSRLRASGFAQISADTIGLDADGLPASSVLFFQGDAQHAGGGGTAFGDGLRCAGGSTIRLKTATAAGAPGSALASYPESGDPPLSIRGGVASPGSRTYQVWYRNAATFCTSAVFNLSNGLQIDWQL